MGAHDRTMLMSTRRCLTMEVLLFEVTVRVSGVDDDDVYESQTIRERP